MAKLSRLRGFVQDMTRLIERHGTDEAAMLDEGEKLLKTLIANDDWLPEEYAQPSRESYRQYLLYCDPFERFSVVSFIWMQGHRSSIHDHTVWGLVGVMRGEETSEEYSAGIDKTHTHLSRAGDVERISPRVGDIHVVSNTSLSTAVSIHVYGANVGTVRRHTYDPMTRKPEEFISGYHNAAVPNLWDRSRS